MLADVTPLVDEHAGGTDGTPPLRVMIATPCTDTVKAGFALDLTMLYGLTCAHGVDCAVIQNRGTIIPQQRAVLVDAAQRWGASHLLFVDSDMRFPKDALFRLLDWNVPIVGVNYARRRHPALPTAEFGTADYLFTLPESDGIAEVTRCGFGLMLIQMGVFSAIAEPWFQIGYTPSDHQYVGEDFYFCHKAREAGFRILIDQVLSREIRHVGELDYTHAHTIQALGAIAASAPAPKIELVGATGGINGA